MSRQSAELGMKMLHEQTSSLMFAGILIKQSCIAFKYSSVGELLLLTNQSPAEAAAPSLGAGGVFARDDSWGNRWRGSCRGKWRDSWCLQLPPPMVHVHSPKSSQHCHYPVSQFARLFVMTILSNLIIGGAIDEIY